MAHTTSTTQVLIDFHYIETFFGHSETSFHNFQGARLILGARSVYLGFCVNRISGSCPIPCKLRDGEMVWNDIILSPKISDVLSFKQATLFKNQESAWLDRDWGKLRIWIIKKRMDGKHVTDICSEAQIEHKSFSQGLRNAKFQSADPQPVMLLRLSSFYWLESPQLALSVIVECPC